LNIDDYNLMQRLIGRDVPRPSREDLHEMISMLVVEGYDEVRRRGKPEECPI
jgi:hypothetical protein